MPLSSGATFAGFTIVCLLGSGSMGEVYLVEHPRLPRRDALKILSGEVSADTEFREWFVRAADLAASLDHPHIVGVHDSGEHDGQLWISMDYVDGADTARLLRQRFPTGIERDPVIAIVTAVAEALDYAHHRGVLHRDVKPANILLAKPDAGARRIFLTGLGVARRLDTISYPAPEQLIGAAIDGRADQYALASTTFHLLTGSPPSSQHLELSDLDRPLLRALSKDPEDRFDSCSDFARALATPRSPRVARPATAPATMASPPQPRRRLRPVALAVAAVLVIVLLVAGIQLVRNRQPADTTAAAQSAANAAPVNQPITAPLPQAAPPGCGDGDALLASMSTRDKLAQLLMVGVTGTDDARAVVADHRVGGIFIGSWTDLSIVSDGSLTKIAESAGPLPLAVSVDEEGGRVERLSSLIGSAPSARELGASSTPEQVYQLAFTRGQQMRNLGITIDFAPVVDVSGQPDDTVIGDRSFSDDPAKVTAFAEAYAQGLRDAGILPVLKHFPGHGNGSGDSHVGSVVTPPLSALQDLDLVPYRTLITQQPVAVMIGHMLVPGLTDGEPASLSPAVIGLLRTGTGYNAPGFNGPVFSDDLSSMRAVSDRYGVEASVLRALQAGADTALWVTTDQVPAVLDRLESAVATAELTLDRVDESVLRMAAVKGRSTNCPG